MLNNYYFSYWIIDVSSTFTFGIIIGLLRLLYGTPVENNWTQKKKTWPYIIKCLYTNIILRFEQFILSPTILPVSRTSSSSVHVWNIQPHDMLNDAAKWHRRRYRERLRTKWRINPLAINFENDSVMSPANRIYPSDVHVVHCKW